MQTHYAAKTSLTSLITLAAKQGAVDDETLLTSNQTRDLVGGVSHMCLWRWQRDERVNFPHPIQINRRNYWRIGDVRRWLSQRTEKNAA